MKGFRTKKIQNKYIKELKEKKPGCPLCDMKELKKFKYWKLIKNDFPYDKIAKRHNMLVPIRHVSGKFLNKNEQAELEKIKNNFIHVSDYNYIMEGISKMLTIPQHFHLHLIKLK